MTTSKKRRRRRPIERVHYDSLTRPMAGRTNADSSNNNSNNSNNSDGNWEISNPVDPTTGLHYDNDWSDLVPTFLRHGYTSSLGLKADQTKDYPLMLVERSYNPPPLRQQLLEILMEECQIPATFFGRDATLACYACGRTSSTVVDIGYHGTTITPVFEGYVEQKAIRRSPVGTLAMDELALEQLQTLCKVHHRTELKPIYQVRNPTGPIRKGIFHRLALLQIGRECRESGAGQSINTAASKTLLVPSIGYTLPDGTDVEVPSQNRFAVADFVFGTPSSPLSTKPGGGGGGDEDMVPTPREEALETLKKKYQDIIDEINKSDEDDEEPNGGGGNGGGGGNSKDDDHMDIDEKKSQMEKYTEATAVGVSSRSTTRGNNKRTVSKSQTNKTTGKKTSESSTTTTKVQFDERILHRACSSYFTNHLESLTASPIANMVCDAAYRCDRDQQATMLGNVIVCGGGACIGPTDQATPDLLREQIEGLIHTHTPGWRIKMLSPSMQERAICSWLGGSILGSLGVFHEMWITKAEYEEWGSAIVNRKCP